MAGCLFLGSCNRRRPKGVLSKNEMAQVLADYHLTYSIAQNLPFDKRYQIPLLIKGTLRKHNITEAEFDSSLVWYTRNPRDLNIIYTRVNRILTEREASVEQEIDAQLADANGQPVEEEAEAPRRSFAAGDSVDVWQEKRFYPMNRMASTRRMEFVLSPDSTFEATDRLEWEFNARFLPASGKGGKAVAFLLARYRPDSIMVCSQILHKNGHYSFDLQNDSARTLQQLWGFIQYYPGDDEKSNGVNQLFVERIRLMRYRKK
jgi:hypothetical protein